MLWVIIARRRLRVAATIAGFILAASAVAGSVHLGAVGVGSGRHNGEKSVPAAQPSATAHPSVAVQPAVTAGQTAVSASPADLWPATAGRVIVIDPGHGGADPGALGGRGIREKDVVLSVAREVERLLGQAGARPILTRSVDANLAQEALPGEATRQRGELAARVKRVSDHDAAVYVSIHANKFGQSTPWRGAQVFWDPRGVPGGERLAARLQAALRAHTGTRRVYRPIEQFVLARSPVPAATVEVGFLSHPDEELLLADRSFQTRLARGICAGLQAYFSEPAVTPPNRP